MREAFLKSESSSSTICKDVESECEELHRFVLNSKLNSKLIEKANSFTRRWHEKTSEWQIISVGEIVHSPKVLSAELLTIRRKQTSRASRFSPHNWILHKNNNICAFCSRDKRARWRWMLIQVDGSWATRAFGKRNICLVVRMAVN